jgi:hypothetical protein
MPKVQLSPSIGRPAAHAQRAVQASRDARDRQPFAHKVTINHAVKVCEWDGLSVTETALLLDLSRRRVRRELRKTFAWYEPINEADGIARAVGETWDARE